MKRIPLILLVLALCKPAAAQITAQQVDASIRRSVAWLKGQQQATGAWSEVPGYRGGVTGLCTLALLNAGVPPDDPAIKKALQYLRVLGKPQKTYTTALQTMVFCLATPEDDRPLIRRNVNWLQSIQVREGLTKGSWGYSDGPVHGDKSNSQFALLALHEADQIGVSASEQTWRLANEYWKREQRGDGSWSYRPQEPSTGSMTCAGLASLVITTAHLDQGDARLSGDTVVCCGEQSDNYGIRNAFDWLGQNFSVTRNPGATLGREGGQRHHFYYLYALERVGRLTGQRFFHGNRGKHDWYREGAEMLVGLQEQNFSGYWKGAGRDESESLIATPFALLFLSKGRRPVVMAKLRHSVDPNSFDDHDWDRHRRGAPGLVSHVEKRWRRSLTWQVIDAAASPEDLIQSPVLFLSGANSLQLTDQQKQNLKIYIEQGGFLFAEACNGDGCDGQAFDRQFRELMAELFPNSSLRTVPPDHPLWRAEQKTLPDPRWPLLGLDASCRTSVVYCPRTLSCYWELSQSKIDEAAPQQVANDIDYCLAVGANVLAYATGRQLSDKLEPPRIAYRENDTPARRGVLTVPKLSHTGGADDAPNALANMLSALERETDLPVNTQRRLVAPTDRDLLEYPLLFAHGRRAFRMTGEQRQALARHIERGGVIFADAICASEAFANSFRQQVQAALPDAQWTRIPVDDPLFTNEYGGFDLKTVSLREPELRTEGDQGLSTRTSAATPLLEGIEIDGRWAVIFSPFDISCSMESRGSLECKGYVRDDAERLAINIILYALQ